MKVLLDKGVSSGAILAIMIMGPLVTPSMIGVIIAITKRKTIVLYLALAALSALLSGYLYELIT